MPFTLKIKLTGLIAFVPMKNNGNVVYDVAADPPDYVWALLLDALNPQPTTDADGHKLDFHRAAIRYDEANFVSGGGRPVFGSGAFPGGRAAFIDDCEVVLPSGTSGERPVLDGADFAKLISFAQVLPSAKPDPGYFAPNPQPGRLSARLKIERGTLSTLQMEPHAVTFDRLPNNSTWQPRRVAKTMLLTIGGLSDALTIKFKRLSSTGPQGSLKLTPRTGCGNNCEIELELMSSPEKLILDPMHYEPKSLRHFEMFWKLVNSPGTRAAPLHQHVASEVVILSGDQLCPEVRP